jgi:hypothetical protein
VAGFGGSNRAHGLMKAGEEPSFAMAAIFERIRGAATFLLAAFIWLHALFFLNVEPTFIAKYAGILRLSSAEAVLVSLLVVFSFLTASGFWRTLLSLLYIYFFPFVLLLYGLFLFFLALRALNRWLRSG